MQLGKTIQQKFNYIFFLAMIGMLLNACSEESTTEQPAEKLLETTEVEPKEEDTIENESLDVNQTTEESTEDGLETNNTTKESLTLPDFINRWNEIDPDGLSGETEISSVDNGLITEQGSIDNSDSYIVTFDENNKNIKKVSLNLSYPLIEDEQKYPIGDNIIHNTSILIDVMEPELKNEDRDKILQALGLSEGYLAFEASIRMDKVTYAINSGDDRFWLDATFE
ncbi:hypothetical protein [Peribacillus butanolivorans]|uniref:hypothetical protein n=1 Tax=Peribacillus butanolivorans TaxID=421767 RepID=UPI003671DDE0